MFKNISTKGLNIGQVLLLTFFYMLFKILLVIGLSEILVFFIDDISLEIEFGEFLSAFIVLFLFILLFKKVLKIRENKYLPFPMVKFLLLTVIGVIGFRLLEDPFFRFKNIFFEKHLLNLSEIETISFSVSLMLRAIYAVLLIPIIEELLFRKIIFKTLLKKYSKLWLAILISSVLFSLIHLSIVSFLPKLIFGIIVAYIYYKSNNIWYPITFHVFSNLLWFLILINPRGYWILLEKLNFKISYWLVVVIGIGLISLFINQYRKIKIN
jgi:hypothetical protein